MLYLPDANILIYAKMSATPEHPPALKWLSQTLDDQNSTVLLCETTILAFLRITTNSKVFSPPLGLKDAREFIDGLLRHALVQLYRPTASHFADVAALMQKHKFAGNLTMDAHLATIALATGATLVTRDKDFKKIKYLPRIDPISS